MSFDRRCCGRETRWRKRERKWKRKAGGSRKRKGFPLQKQNLVVYQMEDLSPRVLPIDSDELLYPFIP